MSRLSVCSSFVADVADDTPDSASTYALNHCREGAPGCLRPMVDPEIPRHPLHQGSGHISGRYANSEYDPHALHGPSRGCAGEGRMEGRTLDAPGKYASMLELKLKRGGGGVDRSRSLVIDSERLGRARIACASPLDYPAALGLDPRLCAGLLSTALLNQHRAGTDAIHLFCASIFRARAVTILRRLTRHPEQGICDGPACIDSTAARLCDFDRA